MSSSSPTNRLSRDIEENAERFGKEYFVYKFDSDSCSYTDESNYKDETGSENDTTSSASALDVDEECNISLDSKENYFAREQFNDYFIKEEQRKPVKMVEERRSVDKEVTVMTTRSNSKAYLVVKGRPKMPFRVTDVVSPNSYNNMSRKTSMQRYRVQSSRTGSLFPRIKPRPLMMDKSKPQQRISVKKRSQHISFSFDESKASRSSASTPRIKPRPCIKPQDKTELKNQSLNTRVGYDELRTSRSRESTAFSDKENSHESRQDDNTTNRHEILKQDEPRVETGAIRDNLSNENGILKAPEKRMSMRRETESVPQKVPRWRKSRWIPKDSPKERIDTVEVEYKNGASATEDYSSDQRHCLNLSEWRENVRATFSTESSQDSNDTSEIENKMRGEHSAKFDIKVENAEIDQMDAGRPLTNEELNAIVAARSKSRKGRLKLIGKALKRRFAFAPKNILQNIESPKRVTDTPCVTSKLPRAQVNQNKFILSADGTVSNQKVVYRKGDPQALETMVVVETNEDLVPKSKTSKILVQIEASTVSKTDANIRNDHVAMPLDWWKDQYVTPGIDAVGRVVSCGNAAKETYGINKNDRVASLLGHGGNMMYTSLDASKVVKVPALVPSSLAAIVVESYLPAFQALLVGVKGPERFSSSSLESKNVMIFGGISSIGQAIIELANLFKANKVFTTAISKHHESLEAFGAIPLETDSRAWPAYINNQIDIAIDPSHHEPDKNSFKAIKVGGTYVSFGQERRSVGSGWITCNCTGMFDIPSRRMSKHTYNVFEQWDCDLEGSKSDLAFLFGQLKLQRITPQLAGTMGLKKVSSAHKFLDGKRRIQGTFVCLPFDDKSN